MAEISRLAHVRAHIELPVLKRASGLLEGFHKSIFKGHGQDFDDLSLYSPGDDVSDIDWKSSARAGIPIIRRFAQQSNLTVVLLADTGRNMSAVSSAGVRKSDVALFLASIVAYVARDRGDRVALIAGDEERLVQRPPRNSTQDLEVMLTSLDAMFDVQAPGSQLSSVLDRALTSIQRRSLLVLLTDEARPAKEHEDALRKLKVKHEVMVLQVSDASPFVGLRLGSGADVRDVDRPFDLPRFFGNAPKLRQQASQYVEQHRQETADILQRNGIVNVVVDSEDHAIQRFTLAVRKQKHLP
ncbi:DUF58 domain-containing protein [Timonella sp. A28]|uniref:DUF58 domain-containing protein n=1 Tax=Timonella sp. A28 TaxID=3442640 RepID=UPI003EBB676F